MNLSRLWMVSALCVLLGILPGVVLGGCDASTAQKVPGSADAFPTDAQACGVGVIAATSGSVDVADLLRCGLSLADAYHLVMRLIGVEQGMDASANGGAAALAPSRIAYRAKLQDLKAKLEAAGAK